MSYSTFHDYSNNTKSVYIIISIALLFIVVTTIAPLGLSTLKTTLGKLIAMALLSYALYKNCYETNLLFKSFPELFRDENLIGIRNNTLLSYTLCISITGLIVYLFYTLFF